MSRILLMLLFIIWMAWRPSSAPTTANLALRVGLFFGFYAILVLTLGVWSRFIARRVMTNNLHKSVGRFNRMVGFARWLVPVWYGLGVWLLGWGDVMQQLFPPEQMGEPVSFMGLQSPAVVLGILPGILTWMGLWWAQFPADRALREQNLLNQLEADLPLVAPPRFRDYFRANFRMQVLFICLPLVLIVVLRDVLSRGWQMGGYAMSTSVELVVTVSSSALVFIFAPAILRRVLNTIPLPDSALRRRLVAMARRSGMKYREILLWRTNNNVCNAAVMGLFPHVRYVLLSDALLETMTDEQIEAVFAHEMGHVVHRHMVWYVIFFILFIAGWDALETALPQHSDYAPEMFARALASAGAFFWCFGFISRQCERQADVYAARLMELIHRKTVGDTSELIFSPSDLVAPLSPAIAGAPLGMVVSYESPQFPNPTVGRHGAAMFSSALHRVAVVNNIPIAKHEWLHGSILKRMNFLRDIAAHPKRSDAFDRQMQRMFGLLLLGLFVSMLWMSISHFAH